MPTTYFGNNTTGGATDFGLGSYNMANQAAVVYTCPGTGPQNVDSLGAYCHSNTSSAVRCAIYTTANVFVMQGSAPVTISARTWYEHVAFVDQAGSPIASPQLTGGTNYRLVANLDPANAPDMNYTAGAAGDGYQFNQNNQAGFPATLSPSGSFAGSHCIRCGVSEPPATNSIAVVLGEPTVGSASF